MLSESAYLELLTEQSEQIAVSGLSAEEIATSLANYQTIIKSVEASPTWSISFAEFVNLALYQPGHGYYVSGKPVIGQSGDFITAPEISPLFGQALLETIKPSLLASGGHIYEFGGGTGKLARSVIGYCLDNNIAIESYNIIEVSPAFIDIQQQTLQSIIEAN